MSDNFSGVTHANQVCVYRERFTYSEDTGDLVGEPLSEFGCKIDLSSGTITFGRKLSTVTLAATTVTIEQMVCDDVSCEPGSSRDVTVVGTWTGVGATTSSKYRSSFDDGTCRYADSWKGSSRNASFVGTIDGVSLGAEGYAYIQEGKSTYRSRCSEI